MTVPVLTIDGPSGAGKGAVSRAVAKRLGWHYLDSGSIYRALAIEVARQGADLQDIGRICEIGRKMQLEFTLGDELEVKLNGENIGALLGTETTGHAASVIAAYPEVRQVLLKKQIDFQQLPGLVADGRDMGSVVFPDAAFKVYLTADAERRAFRRYKQLIEKGIDANLIQITKELEARDQRDSGRATAPLTIPRDAYFLDSSDMTIRQVIDAVINLVQQG
ncbi:MAG: (d)CMP kinase [Methylomonas sp.]|jgi:cytidylate kinase